MTSCARRCVQGLRMTITTGRTAMIDTPATFIRDARVRTGISCIPIFGGVTGGAIQSKHAGMEDRVGMTTRTGG